MKTVITANVRTIAPVVFILLAQRAASQETTSDTTQARSALGSIDSTRSPIVPIPFVGSIERSPSYLITDSTLNFFDYNSAGDFLNVVPGLFRYDLGSPGQLHGITIDGLDNRNIAFMSDGILLNEPLTGTFNPYLYPSENAERVEIITGTSAFWYGLNSTAGAVNFVSKNKKAIHPYTRIRYSEEPYGHGLIDGSFSQDIIRGLNFSIGAFHRTYAGRFPNSNNDHWNGRAKVRYNINNNLNLFASGMYNQTNLGLNGGVDLTRSPSDLLFDQRNSTLVNTDSYEKVTRYDVQAGAAAALFSDTTATTTLTLFHSTNFREYRDEENRQSSNGRFVMQDDRSQWYGMKLMQHLSIGDNTVDFGGEVQRRGVIASDSVAQYLRNLTSIFGKLRWNYAPSLNGHWYARLDNFLGQNKFSAGTEAAISFTPQIHVFIGLSSSYVFMPIAIPAAGYKAERLSFEAGINLSNESAFLDVTYFRRRIKSESPLNLEVNDGLRFGSHARFGGIFTEITGELFISAQSTIRPTWHTAGGIYFWDKLAGGHLDLKTGIRGRAFSSYHGVEFDPQQQIFFSSSTQQEISRSGTLDFVLIAHIGDAYVHLIMENILDRQYVTTTFYPMPERHLRFGLSWEFKD